MRLYGLMVAIGLVLFANSDNASAAAVESFRLGGWNGSAFTDDQSGLFTSCVASADYKSGITLFVEVDTSYNWAIGFSASHWDMEVGSDIPLQYRIDRGGWQQGMAKAETKKLARMPMPQGGYIITRFRRGRTLYVYDGAYNYQFRLTGTSKLMARMAKCVERNTARFGAAPATGTAATAPSAGLGQNSSSSPATSAAAADPQLAVEATQALFNFMGSAGLSGLKLIPDGQREDDDLNGLHAVAANDARTLVAHIFGPGTYGSENELMSLIVADSQKSCEGSFSSGSERVTEGGKEVFASYANCEAGDYQLIERVAIVKRNAGGIMVYGVADTYVGEGGGAPVSPPELTDPDFYAAAAAAAN